MGFNKLCLWLYIVSIYRDVFRNISENGSCVFEGEWGGVMRGFVERKEEEGML